MRTGAAGQPTAGNAGEAWWESRRFALLLVLLSAVPLLLPAVPPLTDLPGHMGRYAIQLGLEQSPALQRFFRFEWALIGNLGVDLLVEALAPLVGLEPAVKLIALSVPPLTVAGFLSVAREVHGRLPPTALFAVPLAWNFPFHYGFINFALAMALAFLVFALWLRLGRIGRTGLRAALFVPIGLAVWIAHAFGWAVLGALVFAAELMRERGSGRSLFVSASRAALHCLPLLPPLLLMIAWRSGEVDGGTGDWFALRTKLGWLAMILRDRWMVFDILCLAVPVLLVAAGLREQSLGHSRRLGAAALLLAAIFLLLPRILLGSAYADMRLAPYLLAVAVLAIRPRPDAPPRMLRLLALGGLAFILVRTAGTTASLALYDRSYRAELAAIERLPDGARVVAFVGRDCADRWEPHRLEHLPSLAIVRRHAFANDQWTMAGAQLLRVSHPAAGGFALDPSQIVVPEGCRGTPWRTIGDSLAGFPREAFDHVWLIRPPAYPVEAASRLRPVWRDGSSVLYEVRRPEGGEKRP